MPKYMMMVLSTPAEGREKEYNEWYQNIHLPDILDVDGYTLGQRYRLSRAYTQDGVFPYAALYDIETDDIDAVMEDMKKRVESGRMTLSDALGPQVYAAVYEEFGSPVS